MCLHQCIYHLYYAYINLDLKLKVKQTADIRHAIFTDVQTKGKYLHSCPNKREVHEGVYAETDIQNACQYPHYLACGDVSHSWHDQTAHALPYIIYLLKLHDADREVT